MSIDFILFIEFLIIFGFAFIIFGSFAACAVATNRARHKEEDAYDGLQATVEILPKDITMKVFNVTTSDGYILRLINLRQ